jgi:predicted Rossmann fold flavoprotein
LSPSLPHACDTAIVGAGAAGLATAIFTRRLNPARAVRLLDGAKKPGAKILVSGGSRCNVTNASVTDGDFWGGKRSIVRRVLRAFPVPDTIAFFAELGVRLHEEADGKLFPDSNRARDVLDALLRAADASGVDLRADHRVLDISRAGERFRITTSRGEHDADAVVLATGGLSLPKTGSDGAGFEIARRLGHSITPTTPGLAPLLLSKDDDLHGQLSGVSHDVELTLWVDGGAASRIRGALLWTHFGISGPAALDMSRHWLRATLEEHDARLTASFCPGLTFDDLERRWTSLAAERPKASVQSALATLVPASAAAALLRRLRIDAATALAHFPREQRRRLVQALVAWPLPVVGSRGYNYAEVTAGGVPLAEIDPATMESRVCPGLFLVGEILDVDGRIGGFNFQWAWSSARVAATALARRAHGR